MAVAIDWSRVENPTRRDDLVEAVLRCRDLTPGRRRRVLFEILDLRQSVIARELGVTRQMIAACLDGARSEKVERGLAEAMGISRERLFPEHFVDVVAGAETIQAG